MKKFIQMRKKQMANAKQSQEQSDLIKQAITDNDLASF